MSLRVRLVLLCVCALAVALGAAGVAAYAAEREALGQELEALLRARAEQVTPAVVQDILAAHDLLPKQRGRLTAHPGRLSAAKPAAIVSPAQLELVTSGGQQAAAAPAGPAAAVPSGAMVRMIAAGQHPAFFRTVVIAGVPTRVYAFPAAPGVAGQVAAPLSQVEASLDDLRVKLAGLAVAALLLLALLGAGVARQALRPVAMLTSATERVVRTGDLRQRVPVASRGRDEVSRLAASVNTMLSALERSVGAQRQLVADASHELRTPLTSLSTNLQLLDEPGGLAAGDAAELIAQARVQADELIALVNGLVELARCGEVEMHRETVRLDLVTAAAADRMSRDMPQAHICARLEPCTVQGDAEMLERAVGNLLDNAVKWNPPGARVDLTVSEGEIVVSDEGPGIAAADLPFVFDRFYRSAAARGRPGSGLGLAIVRQIAELHGATVAAQNCPRGAVLRLRLPPGDPAPVPPPAGGTGGAGLPHS